MKKMLIALAACILAAFATGASADVPVLNGYVVDNAGLLTREQRQKLEGALRALQHQTTAQMIVLTVKDRGDLDAKSFALKVVEKSPIGVKGKDNGLLLMYAVKEDRFRIEVAYGLDGVLPDGLCGSIIRDVLRAKADPIKHPDKKDFAGAFEDAIAVIGKLIAKESGVTLKPVESQEYAENDTHTSPVWYVGTLGLIISGVFGFASLFIGGVSGAFFGAIAGFMVAATLTGAGIGALIGFFVGFIARFILEGFWYVGSPVVEAGFSALGGAFGGGGADG